MTMEMSPYAHKLSCNVVMSTPGMKEGVCNCRTHADWCIRHDYPDWADLDLFCNCGLTYHHKDCASMVPQQTDGSWRHIACTCGFLPEPTVTWAEDELTDISREQFDTLKASFSKRSVPVNMAEDTWTYLQDINRDSKWTAAVTRPRVGSHYTHCPAGKDDTAKCTCNTMGHEIGCVHLIDPYMACNCDYLYDDTMDEKYGKEAEEGQYYRDWMEAQSEWQGSAYDKTGSDYTNLGVAHTAWCNTNQGCNCTGPKAITITLDNPTQRDYDDAIIKLANLRRLQ